MNKNDIKIWSNLTFKTQSYRKNYDLVTLDENIMTEHSGTISVLRLAEQLPPVIIGEYGFSVWNIDLGKKLSVDFNKLISAHMVENTYSELSYVVENKLIDVLKYKKLILIHTVVLCAEYRKHGITEEFIETMYRDFYDVDIAIIALVKPFQDNPIDADYFFKRKTVQIKEKSSSVITEVPAADYYALNELVEKGDVEFNEYKLFSVAVKCGFNRIGNSHLFIFTPENTIKRMFYKIETNEK